MKTIKCAYCTVDACTADIDQTPEFCPRRSNSMELEEATKIYDRDQTVQKIYKVAESVEKDGYKIWQRVRELIEFCKRMEYTKLGIAFCTGLGEETKSLCKILESHDFIVNSVSCSVNGGCNPVGQALILNHFNNDLNIIMGLCIGHDILFSNHSKAAVTCLVVKDRVTCHNPALPLVNRYWKDSFLNKKT